MSLLRDHDWRIRYTPEQGNLLDLVYVPALRCAHTYDRTTGYFNARALTLAARGVEYLIHNGGRMRLIIGCTLDEPEVQAIEKGQSLRDTVEAQLLASPLQPQRPEETDALALLAWMVATLFYQFATCAEAPLRAALWMGSVAAVATGGYGLLRVVGKRVAV